MTTTMAKAATKPGEAYTHWKDLPADTVNLVVFPNIKVALTGAIAARQHRDGLVALMYVDRTIEAVAIPDMNIVDMDAFAIVSAVQACRPNIVTYATEADYKAATR